MVKLYHNQFLREHHSDVQLAQDDDQLMQSLYYQGGHNEHLLPHQECSELQQYYQLLQVHRRLVFLPCFEGNVRQLTRNLWLLWNLPRYRKHFISFYLHLIHEQRNRGVHQHFRYRWLLDSNLHQE